MEHASQCVGRPEKACPTTDKWWLLRELTEGAQSFGLGHRSLGVLKALLSFLPEREIPLDRPAIVFPANRTLSARLNGMPESTLRRHLAALVAAGVVIRRDSPNRKRYARQSAAGGIAFGFDLAPLCRLAARITEAAETAREALRERQVWHAKLTALCHALPDHPLVAEARRALRRKQNTDELRDLAKDLADCQPNTELSDSDSQNERQLQHTENQDSVDKKPSLTALKQQSPTAQSFYPDQLKSWQDAVQLSRNIAPMMGIESNVLREAETRMGHESAATTVLTMLERLATLKNPGGYLRRLSQLAEQGRYDAASMLGA